MLWNRHGTGGPLVLRKCELQEKNVRLRCELCPSRSGALKRTDTAGWAHVVCALYIPEVRFGDVATMEPILVSIVPPERFSKSCCLCEMNGRASKASSGACMSCNKPGCRQSFHVTCAQHSGLLCEEQANNMNNVTYCGYCPHHYAKLKRGHNMKPVPAFKPTNESVTPDTSPEKRPPPPVSGSRSERKKKSKCSRSPRSGGHGDATLPLAFTDSSNSSCPSATELDERRDRSQPRVPLLADEGEKKEERMYRSEDREKESGHRYDERSSDRRADEHARDQSSHKFEDRPREHVSYRGEDQSSYKSLKDQAHLISSKDQSSHRSEDRGKDQSHRSEDRGKDQSHRSEGRGKDQSHRSEGRSKDQSSLRSEDRGKDQSSHRSEDRVKDQASRRTGRQVKEQSTHRPEDRVEDQSSHRSEDRLKDQPSHRPEDLGKDQSLYRAEDKRSHKLSKVNQDVSDQCRELSSNQSVAEVVSQQKECSETQSDHKMSEASTTFPPPALLNHSKSDPSQADMPAAAPACTAAQSSCPAASAGGSQPVSVKAEAQVDSTIAPGFTTANFTETVVTPSSAVFGAAGQATAEPDGAEPAGVAPAQPPGPERLGLKQEPEEAEARPAAQQAPPPAPATPQLATPAASLPQASVVVAGSGVKRAATLQPAEKERRKKKAAGRPRRGQLVLPAAAAQQEVAAADSATGEVEPPPPAASARSPVGDRTSPTSTSGSAAPSVNGISAVHMIGNQLNPSSVMAEKLGLSLAQEMAEQAGYLDPPPGPLVGPPAPGRMTQQGKHPDGTSPACLTELLERQWEQGSQFLLEQSQHFDLAALLSCLYQLRQENQQMEEHMASVTQRRDHLLAVQARLSVPLPTAAPAVVSARANAVRHHQQTAAPAAGTRLAAVPMENGVSEGHHPAAGTGARLSGGGDGRPHNARNGGAVVLPLVAATSHGSGAGAGAPPSAVAAPARQQVSVPTAHAREQRVPEPFRGAAGGGLGSSAGPTAPPGYPQYQLVSPPAAQPPPQSDRER